MGRISWLNWRGGRGYDSLGVLVVARGFEGPINGLTLKDNYLYVSHRGKITDNPVDVEPTGAFAPFGQTRDAGEAIEGKVPASGAIHRIDLDSGEVSIFADGLRNPYGLTVSPQGDIYATNLGYDDRGVRAVKDSPDWVVKVKKDSWYGWPDYAGTVSLSDEKFHSERGINLNPLIDDPPPVEAPLAVLPTHYSPMKLAYAPEGFGIEGLYVNIYGDGQPLTSDLKSQVPTGVIIVNLFDGSYEL